jgi:aminopeptidase N
MPHSHHWISHIEQILHSHNHSRYRGAPPRFGDQTLPEHYPPDLGLEPTHLFIDLYVSIPARSVGGRVTTTVSARRAGSLTLKLDAVDFEDLSVRDLADHALTWQYDGRRLVITWEKPFALQESRKVEVAYRVVAPTAGLYFAEPAFLHGERPRNRTRPPLAALY